MKQQENNTMIIMKNCLQVSNESNMNLQEKKVFLKFMGIRFGTDYITKGYASQWVKRIQERRVYEYADRESKQALVLSGYGALQ